MPVSDQGVSLDRYMLIPRTLIFVTRGEQLLLIKGASHKRLWANLYNGLGGHVERGEDLLAAARRELAEETGLHAPNLWLCGTIVVDTGENPGIGIFVFKGETSAAEITASVEGTLAWVPLNQVFTLPLVEDLPKLLPKVFAATPQMPRFSALYKYASDGQLEISFGE